MRAYFAGKCLIFKRRKKYISLWRLLDGDVFGTSLSA